jgi:hypothetical protein
MRQFSPGTHSIHVYTGFIVAAYNVLQVYGQWKNQHTVKILGQHMGSSKANESESLDF